jgi:hypothetical protein
VASEDDDSEDQAPATHGPRECMACRGSGQVISNLGGTPSMLTCPWCEGGGSRLPEVDAQARWPPPAEAGAEAIVPPEPVGAEASAPPKSAA